ncbi:pyrroloquinoline quinone biosynthesis peptide chaperone PqqD [Neokomagataea thailandica]|uniref:Pyrrolo-quinoline quinone synthesis protein PqqD n=1 Tax=Neokomagataea tanensis NBRC 106556 TaxID=1223519 RepID=A0ABQ0QH17_9PROT|nr:MULTISPECIES: pyrroloquinoline quinone biosynthesis peptide chaperone PqqD [Neokomagataea]GBR44556.1 pyrrolo-quinoline quinone synthesis protein PqqD [Neokomagataea tanensis NBRC 106556]
MTTPPPQDAQTRVPSLARGYRLQHDKVRDLWLIQAPEKALILEGAAPEILRLVDGERSIATIIDTLSVRYDAPRDLITNDVLTLLNDLTEKRALRA